MKIPNLKEERTGYDFLEFWTPSSYEECFENDGGSAPRIRYPDNLRGLYVVCSHYMLRGNSLKNVSLRDLVKYIQGKKNLRDVEIDNVPDINVMEWLRELYGGNKKLRKQIGLDKNDILKDTIYSLRMKGILGLEDKLTLLEKLGRLVEKKGEKRK